MDTRLYTVWGPAACGQASWSVRCLSNRKLARPAPPTDRLRAEPPPIGSCDWNLLNGGLGRSSLIDLLHWCRYSPSFDLHAHRHRSPSRHQTFSTLLHFQGGLVSSEFSFVCAIFFIFGRREGAFSLSLSFISSPPSFQRGTNKTGVHRMIDVIVYKKCLKTQPFYGWSFITRFRLNWLRTRRKKINGSITCKKNNNNKEVDYTTGWKVYCEQEE